MSQWWLLAGEIIALYPTNKRRLMSWSLNVQQIYDWIRDLPSRHHYRISAYQEQWQKLYLASQERPTVNIDRLQLMTHLFNQVTTTLPVFASILQDNPSISLYPLPHQQN